ncbi:acyl carrier protein [Streptomyces sp. ISL-10]|uniref:acyl carrier protein n=1 Tax=Streptomyces sp. ISL-10 TaxID=2819172 RepID=UPI001BE51F1A|nr:acyl carrier protein [Streptomyces sp. ISL-10]MBT2368635.1 acyl carrier protein [Streptomyces sp. ISL-10]
MTTTMTLDDVRRILAECAGDEGTSLDGDILDSTFEELGYDSLAVMEATTVVEREYGVEPPSNPKTPRDLLQAVNVALGMVG